MYREHDEKRRLEPRPPVGHAKSESPALAKNPPLPAVDYALVGQQAPVLLSSNSGALPRASAIVITWASAEWAALQQVFCGGTSSMPYSQRTHSNWTGWTEYAAQRPPGAPAGWSFWGSYRLVEVAGKPVLLFKSNTHLDWPGAVDLTALIKRLITEVQPQLILSIGTAGGAKTTDHIGTVRAVSAGTLYESGKSPSAWPVYANAWKAGTTVTGNAHFNRLLFPVPTTAAALQTLSSKFNQQYGSSYTLAELDPDGLNRGDAIPSIVDETGGGASLLTTSTFVVGTTAGDFQAYSAIEMDDAVIGAACSGTGTSFGFIRNVSDPVQNAGLPATVQGNWGSTIYDAYGFYTSYNGAIAAWAMLI